MNFAVSNIAWPREQDGAVAGVLTGLGVAGVEVAPTKAWPNPLAATPAEVDAYRRFWTDRGLAIIAAQALLFGRPELTIFESAETRAKTLDYLTGIVRLCARLGAKALVFGSPKNRRVGGLPAEDARGIACDFFGKLGEIAEAAGTTVVMEANPPEYGADFVTRAGDAIELVKAVDHPGFRLHLDTGCMTLASDPVRETFSAGAALVRHFHVSEPNLDPPDTSGRVDHAAFTAELVRHGYAGWVSLEMREPKAFALDGFAASVKWMTERYANGLQSGVGSGNFLPSPPAGEGGEPEASRVRGTPTTSSFAAVPSPGGEAPPPSPARGEGNNPAGPLPAVAIGSPRRAAG